MSTLVCPISTERIDSNVSRATVFLNVVLMALFIITQKPVFIYLVAFDYFIRATINGKYSPLRLIAYTTVNSFNLKKKPIDLAQKIFASRLGLLCAVASSILISLNLTTAAIVVAGFLMILSIMDSVINFCVGCIIYNYIVFPFYHGK